MINTKDSFYDQGQRAAKALNENDYARFEFERDFFHKMVAIESAEDRRLITDLYKDGFKSTRKIGG